MNNQKSYIMKTIKILSLIILAIFIYSYIPEGMITFEKISNIFDIFTTAEFSAFVSNNIELLIIIGIILVLFLPKLYKGWIESEEKKKLDNKVEKSTNNLTYIVILFCIGFFLLKSDFIDTYIFKSEKDYTENLKKAPYTDYKSSEIDTCEVDYFPEIISKADNLDDKLYSSRTVTSLSKDDVINLFQDDYNFKNYLSFYQTSDYKYNIAYLRTWFTETDIIKISTYFKP